MTVTAVNPKTLPKWITCEKKRIVPESYSEITVTAVTLKTWPKWNTCNKDDLQTQCGEPNDKYYT